MQVSNMVETAKPVTRLLYTDEDTQRREKENISFSLRFFLPVLSQLNTQYLQMRACNLHEGIMEPEGRFPLFT